MENVRTTSSLERFPPIPGPGRVTIFEVGNVCRTVTCAQLEPVDFSVYLNFPETYHQIMGSKLKPVVPSKIPSIRVTESRDTFIVPTSETWVSGTWSALMDGGVGSAIKFLQEETKVPETVRNGVMGILNFWDTVRVGSLRMAVKLYPHYGLQTDDLIEKFSPIRCWSSSWIRALEWHPTSSKLAVALHDDSIRIFSNDTDDGFPYLKCPDQKRITSISWKPFAERELAVGAEFGVVIWQLDASLKPTANKAKLLSAPGHRPITSVQYSSNGRHLLSSSSLDNSIYVWDANTYEPFVLHRYGGGGIPHARWAPNGTQIFSTTPTSAFRIWSASREWTPSRWKTAGQPVEAICWMPDNGMIVFASASYLYTILVLPFEEDFVDTESSGAAIPVYDLRTIQIAQEKTGKLFRVGGRVQQLLVSPRGTKLAVMFADSDVIALFRVQKKSPDFLFPIGFIRGFDSEYPVAMGFQQNLPSEDLLTIAWSSTRLQHFPLVDNAALVTSRMQEDERTQMYTAGIFNRSSTSLDGSFTAAAADAGGGDVGDKNGSFREDSEVASPRFKIFSSPNGM